MKNKLLFGSLLMISAVTGAFAQNRPVASSDTVTIESETRLLARAYVAAFDALGRAPFTLTMQRSDTNYVLEDVRRLKDVGGLLMVELNRGHVYIVNPRDIVAISEGPAVRAER